MRQLVLGLYLLPRNAAVLLLRGYRAVISPLYGDVCRYYPSCSSYTLQAIQQRGIVLGSALGVYRLVRCHPWAAGGIDDVPPARRQYFRVTRFGFVVASSHGKG
ncbi:membrane protein insertion efficiency factor YidD [Subtercola boreus]|uniref:Putative membrane protein insertion efficiency factor n=1 Tax=Subtercola boreus TaxID=120213 RepID=A0A3E0W8J5_9MICO|nr:membrane protein insertion efficiency factor YidD [Subtercola boreus]RFA17527.1 membrane protein insertion efficiency factor YidD [Subtercola boreus]